VLLGEQPGVLATVHAIVHASGGPDGIRVPTGRP
jgi:hypothetical protein